MTTPNDIIKWAEKLKGWAINHDEGVQHGSGETVVKNVTVCWKATPDAIAEAGERGDDFVIGHEALYDPYYSDFDPERTKGWRDWAINKRRKALLEKHNLTFLRLHTTIDHICIGTEMGKWLELRELPDASGGRSAWETPECTLEELASRVKKISGLSGLRVSAPNGLKQKVRRVGLLVGGAALCPNGGTMQPGVEAGVDVFIAGETDNYGFRFASECGIPLIETSHEVSENPGFRHFSKMLAQQFPELRVSFFENPCPYVTF
jgi:putative NIF3 family GTP cyclohydrolase 1 type 2